MLQEIVDSALSLNDSDIQKLIETLQKHLDDNEHREELKRYKTINKVSKTMKDFSTGSEQFDYLISFACDFTTNDIRCFASYNGETGMFSPQVEFNNCFKINHGDTVYHDLLEDDIDNIDKYITDMNKYKELCKKFKYKRVTLAKKIVEIVHSMQDIF